VTLFAQTGVCPAGYDDFVVPQNLIERGREQAFLMPPDEVL
jgi:hypothetical protein